jgi:hypothetical protein
MIGGRAEPDRDSRGCEGPGLRSPRTRRHGYAADLMTPIR